MVYSTDPSALRACCFDRVFWGGISPRIFLVSCLSPSVECTGRIPCFPFAPPCPCSRWVVQDFMCGCPCRTVLHRGARNKQRPKRTHDDVRASPSLPTQPPHRPAQPSHQYVQGWQQYSRETCVAVAVCLGRRKIIPNTVSSRTPTHPSG